MKFPFNAITMLSLIGIPIVGTCYIYKPNEETLESFIVLMLIFIISITVDICNLIIPTDKKDKVLALRNLNADTKLIRGSKLGENMSEDADNESVGKTPLTKTTLDVVSRIDGGINNYKRRFVEDDTILNYKEE